MGHTYLLFQTHSPRIPDLDGPVARGGHDVLLVKVDDVDRGSVADEHAAQVDLGRRDLNQSKTRLLKL